MNNCDIIKKIKKGFKEVNIKEIKLSRREWTEQFLKKLTEIGRHEKFKVYPSKYDVSDNDKNGEWLFDLCWSIEGNGKWMEKWKGLKLICECEWNISKEEILYDFQKLAVAKADIKIMIVQFNNAMEYETIKAWCENAVDDNLRNDNSIYFLVGSGPVLKFKQLWP